VPPRVSAADAVKCIKSGDRVWVHSVAAAPQRLLEALVARAPELEAVELLHIHTEGPAAYADPKYARSFRSNNAFVGANVRGAVQAGHAGYIPIFLSEVPLLFTRGVLPLDVALVTVSPPDAHGYCSLGTSVDATITAVECARTVVAQVNPRMPRTHGDGIVHISAFERVVDVDEPLPTRALAPPSDVELAIGRQVAALVEGARTR
jgi:4-hydroxybutyrate CoA-transferase